MLKLLLLAAFFTLAQVSQPFPNKFLLCSAHCTSLTLRVDWWVGLSMWTREFPRLGSGWSRSRRLQIRKMTASPLLGWGWSGSAKRSIRTNLDVYVFWSFRTSRWCRWMRTASECGELRAINDRTGLGSGYLPLTRIEYQLWGLFVSSILLPTKPFRCTQ